MTFNALQGIAAYNMGREQKQQSRLSELAAQAYAPGADRNALTQQAAAVGGMGAAQGFEQVWAQMDARQQAEVKQRYETIARSVASVASIPDPNARQQAYLQEIQRLSAQDIDVSQFANIPVDDALRRVKADLLPLESLFAGNKPMNVAPGGAIVDPATGRVVYQAPFKPNAPEVARMQSVQVPMSDGSYRQMNFNPLTGEYTDPFAQNAPRPTGSQFQLSDPSALDGLPPADRQAAMLAMQGQPSSVVNGQVVPMQQGPQVGIKPPKVPNGQRISVNPETGEIVIEEGAIGPPTTATRTGLQKDTISLENQLARLESVEGMVVDDYLTYMGAARGMVGRVADKSGLGGPAAGFAADRRAALQGVQQFFNEYRRQITGAAAAVQELEQLKKSTINGELGPAEFRASLEQIKAMAKDELSRNQQRLGVPAPARAGAVVQSPSGTPSVNDPLGIR